MSISQNKTKKKTLLIKEKKQTTIPIPMNLIKNQFLYQLKDFTTPQFNLFMLFLIRMHWIIKNKEIWNNFKNSNLELVFNINEIFSKEQIKNYILKKQKFKDTRKMFEKLIQLNFSIFNKELQKFQIFNIFSSLEFSFKTNEKITLILNRELLLNKIENLIASYRIVNTKDLINTNLSKQELRFRMLVLLLVLKQNDKNDFNKNLIELKINELYDYLKIKQKKFYEFNRQVFKPLIKKLKETEYFKKLEYDFERENRKITIVNFEIPNFNFVQNKNNKRFNKLETDNLESPKEKYCKKCNTNNFVFCRIHFSCVKCCSCSWN